MDKREESVNRLVKEWFAAGFANAITSSLLNPMDVAKTRLQSTISSNHHLTLMHVLKNLYLEGGILGLWTPGLTASCLREMINSGARAGLYCTVRDQIHIHLDIDKGNDIHLLPKVLAAMSTGTVGAFLSNPVDVVKIRLMTNPRLYKSTFHAFPEIISKEGILALYKGLIPSTLRGTCIAAGELATYDHSKSLLKSSFQFKEGLVLHITSSLITGLIATTVAAPFDMMKTRAMNSQSNSGYQVVKLFYEIVNKEGMATLFRGWLPSYFRLGPHAFICFPIFEKVREIVGLDYF